MVESALRWFDATHDLAIDGLAGRAWYRRVALPTRGSVGDQDARLMEALAVLKRTHDDLLKPKATA